MEMATSQKDLLRLPSFLPDLTVPCLLHFHRPFLFHTDQCLNKMLKSTATPNLRRHRPYPHFTYLPILSDSLLQTPRHIHTTNKMTRSFKLISSLSLSQGTPTLQLGDAKGEIFNDGRSCHGAVQKLHRSFGLLTPRSSYRGPTKQSSVLSRSRLTRFSG